MEFIGIGTVAIITVLVYIIALGVRAMPIPNKWIPCICGVLGAALGCAALAIGMPEFPAGDYITAAGVGGASGLAATGVDQAVKQLKK